MTDIIITPNLQNCSTISFPTKIKSRRLAVIIKQIKQGEARGYDLAEGIEYAAKEGHLEALKYLVHHGASLRHWGKNGLIQASERGHLDIIKYLVDNGTSQNIGNALIKASSKGHLHILKFLLRHNDCHYDDITEAFTRAIIDGQLDIVKYFVTQKIVNVPAHESALIAAACIRGHLNIIQYLIGEGADFHKEQELALCYAAEGGHFNIVKYLIERGANIHAQNEQALYETLKHNHFLLAIYLLQQGADPHNDNIKGLLITIYNKHPEFHFLCQSFGYLKNMIEM